MGAEILPAVLALNFPARGRKLGKLSRTLHRTGVLALNFPARGRKPNEYRLRRFATVDVLALNFPARGRKPKLSTGGSNDTLPGFGP